MTAVHQLVPNFGYGDAISNHVRALRGVLRSWGHPSDVYARHIHRQLARDAHLYLRYRSIASRDNLLVLHFSIGSELTSFFADLPDRKVVVYHNITPPEYYVGINPKVADGCRRGRRELARLAGVTDLGLGVSEFNRLELEAVGFRRTGVLPILVDWSLYEHPPVRSLEAAYGAGTNLLFVGRIAPNKRIQDLIKVYYFYRRLDPKSRLLLVGGSIDTENYLAACQKLAVELDVADGVIFTGGVSQAELCAYYRLASAYLSMSEHEGFCVPLLEAMHFGVPVVAFAAAGVPGTLGHAGLLVHDRDFPVIAEVVHEVVTTPAVRASVIAGQRARLRAFDAKSVAEQLRSHLDGLGGTGAP
jgi:L-malate glycosyltransferase